MFVQHSNTNTMKKLTLAIFLWLFNFIFSTLLAQTANPDSLKDWVSLMRDPKVNVHDVQNAFYKWYNEKSNGKETSISSEGMEDESYELFKRWEWYNVPRADAKGNRPDFTKVGEEYANYLKTSSAHAPRHKMTLNAASWIYTGNTSVPTNAPDTSGFGGDGRINRLRVFPGNNNIIFACAASGGLWKTTNGGVSWSTNTDQLGTLTTSDIAINPLNTNIMYLATGDGDGVQSIYPTPGTVGVLKSYDGGNTWNPTTLAYDLSYAGASQYSVNELLIDPNDTSILLAATTFGIWRSTNSGATWTEAAGTGSGNAKWFHSIEFHLGNPSIVYAATSTVFNGGGCFYRSLDTGASWTQLSTGLPNNSFAEGMEIGVTAADTSLVYVLACRNIYYDYEGLYVSTDDGTSFTEQSGYPTQPNVLGRQANGNDYGTGLSYYALTMAVSQTNKDSIWVGGVNIWASADGGVTWKPSSNWFDTNAPYIHCDIHNIQFIPGTNSQGYLVGCDGGVFITSNAGTNWTDISNNLEIGQQYYIGAAATSPTQTLSAWQDNGVVASTSPVSAQKYGGDGTGCFIDWSNPSTIYSESPGAPTFIRSTNGGTSWKSIINGITEINPYQWLTPFIQDPTTSTTLYCGINNVWKTTNSGSNWSKISTWGNPSQKMVALAVDSANVNYIYAAYNDTIEMTPDGGTNWYNITGTLPTDSTSITAIAVSSKTPSHIWVVFSGYYETCKVFASTNSGATWTNISNGLPNLPVNTIVCESGSPNGIFVGTDQGVYYHDTNTSNWTFYNNGLPLVMIGNLQMWKPVKASPGFRASTTTICAGNYIQFTDTSHNSPAATLIAATFGRGTWETPLSTPSALSWSWTFTGGNPDTSTAQNPLILYTTQGTFPVKLIVTNVTGKDSIVKNNFITVNANPSVNATVIVNVNCFGESTGSLSSNTIGGATPYTYSWSNSQNTPNIGGLSAGIYTLNVTDNNGCSGTASVNLTQPTAITATHDSIGQNGPCNGLAAVTANGGVSPYTYFWTTGGQTTDTINEQCAGTYCCIITDNNNCTYTTCVTINLTTGIGNNSESPLIDINPNPSTGKFSVTGLDKGMSVELYDYLGRKVDYKFRISNYELTINISDWADGIYLIRVLDKNGNLAAQKKVLKTN